MARRALIITFGVSLTLVCSILMYSILHNSAKNKEQMGLKQRKLSFLQHDRITNLEKEEYIMLGDSLAHEAEACNRLHLSRAEKSRRLYAVRQAGTDEMRRVQSSGFKSAFRLPPTD